MPPLAGTQTGADNVISLRSFLDTFAANDDATATLYTRELRTRAVIGRPTTEDGLAVEAWAQGFMVGSLIIMACITVANMRRGVLLHKLILLELILGIWQGFWVLFHDPVASWWLSVGAIFLNASWSLHNVIAWMKIKPFLTKTWSWIFIGTIILVQPYWVVEIFANFQYFHGWGTLFLRTRPWESLARDPWWIITTILLFYKIGTGYELSTIKMIQNSPRFGILLSAMILSVVFIICDILSVTGVFSSSLPTGINPFWKLSFVFKCLTDSVILDDFKTALDRLNKFRSARDNSILADSLSAQNAPHARTWDSFRRGIPSPDADSISHPVWSGKKTTTHFENSNEHGRQLCLDRTMRRDSPGEVDFITVPRDFERIHSHPSSRGAG